MNELFVGYKAADLTAEALHAGAVCHVLDIYHAHAIAKVFPGAAVICTPHLPETAADGGAWDTVRLRTGPKLASGELALDLLQECVRLCGGVAALKRREGESGRLVLDYVGRERDRNDLLDKVRDRTDRVFRSDWTASVPNGPKLVFTSYPGCFCHRRLDEGGLALAEVVSRELAERESAAGLSLLDMGCGCGLVGLLVATRFEGMKVTLVDSHTRAIEAASENVRRFGVAAECVLADDGLPARAPGGFDLFVGNPPYYSDYRIAEVFLETAKRNLKPGGICYTVCKNAAGLEPVQRRYFPEVEIIRRRGYAVLKSSNKE